MSRVVVAAPYPTMPGPEARATLAMVRSLVEAGDDVTVVSPVPSAAHHHADLTTPRGALRLASVVAGADRLVLRLDVAAVAGDGAGGSSLARRTALGLSLRTALKRAGRSEVRLDGVPDRVSRRWAALVLGPAERVVVSSESERAALVAAGVGPAKVAVEADVAADHETHHEAGLGTAAVVADDEVAAAAEVDEVRHHRRQRVAALGDAASIGELERFLQAGAGEAKAAHRRALSAGRGPASAPLRQLGWMERAQTKSAKPAGVILKRLISKALGWQFDNVIQQVNRLHQATIEAIESLEAAQRPADVDGDDDDEAQPADDTRA